MGSPGGRQLIPDNVLVEYPPQPDINPRFLDGDDQKMLERVFRVMVTNAENVSMKL